MRKLLLAVAFLVTLVSSANAAGEMKPIGWAEEYFPGATSGATAAAPVEKKAVNPYAGKDVNTYLVGSYVSVADAKAKLESAGYTVVATYAPVKKGTTIVFTDAALQAEAAHTGRAHAAVLRMFVDDKEQTISITNPIYFGKAFMQDDFKLSVFQNQLKTLNATFPGLKPSVDTLNFDKLAGFHFMIGMPYYEDADKLGEGTNEALLAKAKKYKKGKLFLYELKLSNGTTLVGYDLSKRTKKFVKKIGRANAAILPWSVVIEDGKATALNAKYYIAISYPLFTMTQFMGIATVPGAIEKELTKPFKK